MSNILERISDTELDKRLNAVRASIRRNGKLGGDTEDTEVELCYLEREEEIRIKRKTIHIQYLADYNNNIREEEEALQDYLGE